jgi:hypothetical protein
MRATLPPASNTPNLSQLNLARILSGLLLGVNVPKGLLQLLLQALGFREQFFGSLRVSKPHDFETPKPKR